MDTDSQFPQELFPEPPEESWHGATLKNVPLNAVEAEHSERNILQWTSYLPEDCVKTMIEMGWDVTT
jgi:hypothetical protein